ncbi:LysR family transcriptional regulator [Dictyobacter formicarum]|uniref:LysR family transcriptional regulator n=1 Tax=Dictyobacter formicarum TaxID=2778368 RepID=A0ABQ3VR46_9CHLR|nr:LysR family transcriptional regulator [Dictyobacter formicarum]GHO88303.1 LysR family transcriptional regulator [Dictyobacter formicarum]
MNFSQLQSFVALADTGSFTEAAYAINLTQSAVSHALAALESELGVTLLERNRKGVVSLTAVGQKIIPHVRTLLAQAESIEQEARAAHGKTSGKLRLGSINSIISPRLLASLLTNFQQKYPDMEVVLFEGAMQEVGEWIEDSIVDVGFVVLPAPNVESSPVTTDELCVLVPPGHRLRTRSAATFKELREEGFIMEKSQCALHLLQRVGFGTSKNRPHIRYQASDSATILAMVREGLGITLLPRQMLPQKLEGAIALPLDPPQPLQIGLGIRSARVASPGATLFIQTAQIWAQERDELF